MHFKLCNKLIDRHDNSASNNMIHYTLNSHFVFTFRFLSPRESIKLQGQGHEGHKLTAVE